MHVHMCVRVCVRTTTNEMSEFRRGRASTVTRRNGAIYVRDRVSSVDSPAIDFFLSAASDRAENENVRK